MITSVTALTLFSLFYIFYTGQDFTKRQSSYAEEIIGKCELDAHCAMDSLNEIAKKEEKSIVLATFGELITAYDQSMHYCHPQAHHLAMFLYHYVGNLTEALSYADQRCANGLSHGLVQTFFITQVRKGINPDDISVTDICPVEADHRYNLERWKCLHGIGHGLMASYDYDVFRAVERCRELEPGWERLTCSRGVFMENVDTYLESRGGTFDKDDVFFPCNAIDAEFLPACYDYHASYILSKNSFDLAASFEVCDRIDPQEFVKYCYRGMGRHILLYAVNDMEKGLNMCQRGQDQYHTYCLRGLAVVTANNLGIDRALEFCKFIPGEFKADCYEALGRWILMLESTSEGRRDECSKAENQEYADICMRANLDDLKVL